VTVAGILVVAAVTAALVLLGSPRQARLRRLDDQRLSALQAMTNAADAYLHSRGALPDTLDQLATDQTWQSPSVLHDPETGAPYGYRKIGPSTYQLCARFATASGEEVPPHWRHGPGRACFSQSASAYAPTP
jgi:type II secretory pathway pseudopilin PulG